MRDEEEMRKDYNKYINEISNNIDNKFKEIVSIQWHYPLEDLIEVTKNLSDEEIENILSELINDYLLKIKPMFKEEKYKEMNRTIDEITDFFYKSSDDEFVEYGDDISNDLLLKLNDNTITLPIEIKHIKQFCIRSKVPKEIVRKTLIWIVLRLRVVYLLFSDVTVLIKT